jgi:DNA-binding NarL/FixJ family response regulator
MVVGLGWGGEMYRVAKSNARDLTRSSKAEDSSRRVLLIVTPADSVSECWGYAIEREFPSISVEQVPTLEAACNALDHPVSLILVDTAFLFEIDLYADDLSRFHPAAPIAVMQSDDRNPVSLHDVFASKVVRGVLPMNLKLDVWLSVIRLMLRGGEYFPFAMLQSYVKDPVNAKDPMNAKDPVKDPPAQESDDPGLTVELANGLDTSFDELEDLTEREIQILEMVSRGLQNKIIAATLRLSEYTVKIHLHHIITKLGAHNRTEAAAIFHERRNIFHGGAERRRMQRLSPSSA